ncbi:MAG: aldo/keto reductase [Acidimicrobiales bacterium]
MGVAGVLLSGRTVAAAVLGRRAGGLAASLRQDGVMTNDSLAQFKTLADGHTIPILALGVWQIEEGRKCVEAVRAALDVGYRHIDTAQIYGNEASVGEALRESGVPREDVFLTTKFRPTRSDPAREMEGSLKRLGVDYVDLYLVHWPQGGATWAWAGMQRAQELGYTRSIGVSNFSTSQLDEVIALGGSLPVADQVQLSPFEYRRELIAAATARQVLVEAYSPLVTGRHLGDRHVAEVAERVGRTPAQVLLRWCVQHDLVVLPKSSHPGRIAENAAIFDFTLSEADMAALDALDRSGGSGEARERRWW